MWRCQSCGREYDEWVDKCYTCDIPRSENDLNQESKSEDDNNRINNVETKFAKLRSYSNLIVSVGYILAGIQILYSLLLLSNMYYLGETEGFLIITATVISVVLTIVTFTIIGHMILVFLDIEENTRQTSEKLDKLSSIIEEQE